MRTRYEGRKLDSDLDDCACTDGRPAEGSATALNEAAEKDSGNDGADALGRADGARMEGESNSAVQDAPTLADTPGPDATSPAPRRACVLGPEGKKVCGPVVDEDEGPEAAQK